MLRFLCLIVPLFAVSCGSSSFNVQQRPAAPFKTFGQVVVEPFRVDGVEKLEATEKIEALEAAAYMTQSLKKRLEAKKWFKEGEGGKTLTIKGIVVGFDPGSRALRFFLTFCAGSGEIVVDTTFFDSSGNAVARGNSKGTVLGGFFGGSIDSACDRAAKAILDFINASYEHKLPEKPE